jgi:polar amino acid transport system substrate-binding protein
MSLAKNILALFFVFFACASSSLKAQTLRIYCEDDRPLQYYDAENKLTGFSVELVKELQKRVGNTDKIQVVPWARGLVKIDHDSNTLLFSMARTPEREALYQWIGPITINAYGFYAKADSQLKINSLEEIKKIGLVGVYRDDIRDKRLTSLGFTNLDRATSSISSFKKLMLGRIAMYVDSKNGVEDLANASGYKASDVKLIFPFFTTELYIAASKTTDPAVVAQWNQALDSMKKDKSFLKLQKKYPNAL